MLMIELILPYPPSLNHMKSIGKIMTTKEGKLYQHRYDSVETKRFYHEVWLAWHKKKTKEGLSGFHDSTISLEVYIGLYPPNHRKSDIDNRLKAGLDSLQRAGVIANDYQIARLVVERREIVEGGRTIVKISKI